jgi:hypothetical protein
MRSMHDKRNKQIRITCSWTNRRSKCQGQGPMLAWPNPWLLVWLPSYPRPREEMAMSSTYDRRAKTEDHLTESTMEVSGCSFVSLSLSPNPQLHRSSSHKSRAYRTRLGDTRLVFIELYHKCGFGFNVREGKLVWREPEHAAKFWYLIGKSKHPIQLVRDVRENLGVTHRHPKR